MSDTLRKEQQFVTGLVPWIYVVMDMYLFSVYPHWVLLLLPLLLLSLNPIIVLYSGFLPKWRLSYVYMYNGGLWVASLGSIVFSGGAQSFIFPVAFFTPIGYAALFFSRRWFLGMIGLSAVAVYGVYVATGVGFSDTRLSVPVTTVDCLLFSFVIVIARVLYDWNLHAKQSRRLLLMKGDRNNPHNQLRLNRLFVVVFVLLHGIQGLVSVGGWTEWPVFLFAVIGLFAWMMLNRMLYAHQGYAFQPLTVLVLLALCTASMTFSGGANSLLFPGLLLLPVMFMSLNASRRIGTGTGLLALVLMLLVLWATQEIEAVYWSRLFVYGILFFFLPQVAGYTIREQMRLLKEGNLLDQKVERLA